MLRDELPAEDVVHTDAALVATGAPTVEQDDRRPAFPYLVVQLGWRLPDRGHEDPRDPLLFEKAKLTALTRTLAAGVAEDHEVVRLAGGVFDAARDIGKERVVDVEHHETDRLALRAAQLSRGAVPDEADLLDGRLDALARGG
jgi:hypothetical protein